VGGARNAAVQARAVSKVYGRARGITEINLHVEAG
jgi:hypothetical protein